MPAPGMGLSSVDALGNVREINSVGILIFYVSTWCEKSHCLMKFVHADKMTSKMGEGSFISW